MKRKALLFVCVLALAGFAKAQFSIDYGFFTFENFIKSINTSDGNYLVIYQKPAGWSLLKYSAGLTIIFDHFYDSTDSKGHTFTPTDVIETGTNYLVLGYERNNTITSAGIARFNKTGDLQSIRLFIPRKHYGFSGEYITPRRIAKGQNGEFYIIGESNDGNNYYRQLLYMHIKNGGKSVSAYAFSSRLDNADVDDVALFPQSDGGCVVFNSWASATNGEIQIMRFNKDDKIVKTVYISPTTIFGIELKQVISLGTDGYLASGPVNGSGYGNVFLMKFDTGLTAISVNSYTGPTLNSSNAIDIVSFDGIDYIGYGYTLDSLTYCYYTYYNFDLYSILPVNDYDLSSFQFTYSKGYADNCYAFVNTFKQFQYDSINGLHIWSNADLGGGGQIYSILNNPLSIYGLACDPLTSTTSDAGFPYFFDTVDTTAYPPFWQWSLAQVSASLTVIENNVTLSAGCAQSPGEKSTMNPHAVLQAFPNPAADHINFSFDVPVEAHIQIYDSMGKLITSCSFSASSFTTDLKSFSNGIYFYCITIKGKTYSGKFVKSSK